MAYRIGDIVQARVGFPSDIFSGLVLPGDIGKIVARSHSWLGIDWGKDVRGHQCGCRDIPYGYGTFVHQDCVLLVEADAFEVEKLTRELEEVL